MHYSAINTLKLIAKYIKKIWYISSTLQSLNTLYENIFFKTIKAKRNWM